MEIWLDTCNSNDIVSTSSLGIVYGVTTNPTLLAKARKDPETIINSLLECQDGPVAVQLLAENSDEMVQSALNLHAFSGRIIIKVPATQQGFVAMRALVMKNVSVMATAIFTPAQALLAALIGVDYVAPYVGRMLDANIDAFASLEEMLTIYQKHQLKTKILAASLRTQEQVIKCAEVGVHAITFSTPLFLQFIANHPLTDKCVDGFANDWRAREHQATFAAAWPDRASF